MDGIVDLMEQKGRFLGDITSKILGYTISIGRIFPKIGFQVREHGTHKPTLLGIWWMQCDFKMLHEYNADLMDMTQTGIQHF